MTAEWSTARLEDFIPFIPEVYVRLTERINETFWPLHLVGLLLGLGWTMFPGLRGSRWTGVPWAIVWVWVGTVYHLQHYTNLHWAGTILAAGFYLQALLMLLLTSPSGARTLRLSDFRPGQWAGMVLFVAGMLLTPVLSAVTGSGPAQAEVFGMHPDPTAMATLGFLLVMQRGGRLISTAIVPLMCCLFGGLTLLGLDLARAFLPLAAAGIGLTGLTASCLAEKSS